MKKALITILTSCIVILLVPFHFLYADDVVTISLSNIVDVVPVDRGDWGSTLYCILDNQYQGTLNLKVNYSYYNGSSVHSTSININFSVQGNIGYGNFQTILYNIRNRNRTEPNLEDLHSIHTYSSMYI